MLKIQDKKDGMMGMIIDGVEWVTNGHWAYQSRFVTCPEHGYREFAKGNNWASEKRSIIRSETFQTILVAPKEEAPGKPTSWSHGLLGKDSKPYAGRLFLRDDGLSYAAVRSEYLIDAVEFWFARLSTPKNRISFWTAEVETKGVVSPAEIQAVVMPMLKADDLVPELKTIQGALAAAGKTHEVLMKARREEEAKGSRPEGSISVE